ADRFGRGDGVRVEAGGGAARLVRAGPFLEHGLPLFVDQPFTNSVHDAREIARTAALHDAPVFSSASLRFTPDLVALCEGREALGAIHGADVWTPASTHPRNPGLFHYGIHGVEALYTIMGPGCHEVWCASEP